MRAVLRYSRITPRKMTLVADLVRGKNVNTALSILKLTDKRGAPILEKLLRSAIANAEVKNPVNPDVLYIKELLVDRGPTLKRWLPRARGRVSPIQKKTTNVSLTLAVK